MEAHIAQFAEHRTSAVLWLVVRNGSYEARRVLASAGAIEVRAPRVSDERTDPLTGRTAAVLFGALAAVVPQAPAQERGSAGLAMVFKLIESAKARWRAVNAPHLVALVPAGAAFTGGKFIERPAQAAA